jgi:hypothetical protein
VAVPFHKMIGVRHALDHGVGLEREQDLEAAETDLDALGRVERV